jgi:hypothetical protein
MQREEINKALEEMYDYEQAEDWNPGNSQEDLNDK